MAKCPVCKIECGEYTICNICGFNDVNRIFVNQEEAEYWRLKIVEPYKIKYKQSLKKNEFNEVLGSEAKLPVVSIANGQVVLGKYPQSKDGDLESINWFVIKEVEDRLLLLSEKCLDVAPFYNVKNTYDYDYYTWYNSDLRHWLNEEFYNAAFSENEKELILPFAFEETGSYTLRNSRSYQSKNYKFNINDKVFLLAKKEVPISIQKRRAEPTEYAKSKGLKVYNPNKYSYWWLRDVTYEPRVVRPDGEVDKYGRAVNSGFEIPMFSWQNQSDKIGVRPAIWVKK